MPTSAFTADRAIRRKPTSAVGKRVKRLFSNSLLPRARRVKRSVGIERTRQNARHFGTFGIIIRMYYDEHNPPHIHVEYQGNKALLDFHGNIL